MKKIEHLGIAVANLEEANEVFKRLFNRAHYKSESVEREGVTTSFFQVGESKIELLEATDPESAIGKYVAKSGQGMHHIAFDVDDILVEMDRLKKEGFRLLSEEPQTGADNKLVCFVHPKSCNGVLVELTQEKPA